MNYAIESVHQGAQREQVIDGFAGFLVDTHALRLKTLYFQQNARGLLMELLQRLFAGQASELLKALQAMMGRAEDLGVMDISVHRAEVNLGSIRAAAPSPGNQDMIQELMLDHGSMVRIAQELMKKAKYAEDEISLEILRNRLQAHREAISILKGWVEKK